MVGSIERDTRRQGGQRVKLTKLVGCDDGECPAVYLTDRGTYVFQGTRLTEHGRDIPAHETMAEIPMDLIRKAISDGVL
jgi:hypothetical protein